MKKKKLIFVLDFDGTITQADVGNEICNRVASEKYKNLQKQFRDKQITLRDYQKQMWEGLELNKDKMRKIANEFSNLRAGVEDFFQFCSAHTVDVYIASCGLRDYIEPIVEIRLSETNRKCLREISCHDAVYSRDQLVSLKFRDSEEVSTIWPFDKGRWCREIKARTPGNSILVGVGNGSSDQNFVGSVDMLFATDGFASFCKKQNIKFTEFESFFEIKDSIMPLI